MNGILGEIVEYKRHYVAECKKKLPLKNIEELVTNASSTRGFTKALESKGCALIAEIKTASPSKGIIRDDVDIGEVARIYEHNGASCISVLTDEKYFKGHLERLSVVRNEVTVPLLRKDFIIDVYQIFEARHAGADAVLLIAACLDDEELRDFIETAALLEMDSLVEVHNEVEMNRIAVLNTKLVGINNRNLKTFNTELAVTKSLASCAPEQALLVSESGIHTAEDVRTVHSMGAGAVLVGEAIMREKDMAMKVRELSQAISAKASE